MGEVYNNSGQPCPQQNFPAPPWESPDIFRSDGIGNPCSRFCVFALLDMARTCRRPPHQMLKTPLLSSFDAKEQQTSSDIGAPHPISKA